jgi:hypothetical protein
MFTDVSLDFMVTMLTLFTKVTGAPEVTFATMVTMDTSLYWLLPLGERARNVPSCECFLSFLFIKAFNG